MKTMKPVVAIKLPPTDLIKQPKSTGLASKRHRDVQKVVNSRERNFAPLNSHRNILASEMVNARNGPFRVLDNSRSRIDSSLVKDRRRRMIPRG